jgi:hypothetical protein
MIKFYNKISKLLEINEGVRQGCSLSPALFNIYLAEIITKWQKQENRHQTIEKPAFVNAVICGRPSYNSGHRRLLTETTHKLNRLITEHGLTISVQKTKSMAFKGRDPVRTKIVIDNKIIERVKSFNYLGNTVCFSELGNFPILFFPSSATLERKTL